MSATGFQRRRRMAEIDGAASVLIDESGKPVSLPAGDLEIDIAAGGEAVKPLAELTVKELRALAADKGIALGRELTAKADILAVVEKALGESSAHSS